MSTSNRVFFPMQAIDRWSAESKVELTGSELVVLGEGRRYQVEEAVHVLREVTGGEAAHALLGKVKTNQSLLELGAELFETSMILGDNAYDVVPGWLGTPTSSFSAHQTSEVRRQARATIPDTEPEPENDEEILAQFLLKSLQ